MWPEEEESFIHKDWGTETGNIENNMMVLPQPQSSERWMEDFFPQRALETETYT